MRLALSRIDRRGIVFVAITTLCFATFLIAAVGRFPAWLLVFCAVVGVSAIALAAKMLIVDGMASIHGLAEKHYNIIESIPDGFFIVDRDLCFSHVNERAEELLNKGASELVGRRVQDVLDPLASELVPEMLSVRSQGLPLERLQHFASTDRWIDIRIQPAHDETLVYLRDVTERKKTELLLKTSATLRLLLSQLPAVIWTVDLDLRLTSIVGAALADQRLWADDLVGAPYESTIDDATQRHVAVSAVRRTLAGEAVTYETYQNGRWLKNDVEPLRNADGALIGAIGVMLDVTDVRETADRFARLAHQDALTGLPNRLALEERLPALLAQASATDSPVAVLFVDLDRFKTINDTLGHRVGDDLLRGVAVRLQTRLSDRTSIFRSGGDEFVVVVEGVSDRRDVMAVASQALAAFQVPFVVDGRELFVTCSIGTSLFPQNARTSEELVAFADSAMYRAKETGRNNVKFYDGTMHAVVLERLGLEQDLRHALARDEFELLFQPIVDVASKRIVAAEALIRWRHPVLGELLPDTFIPIAEETGVIVDISRWVLDRACSTAVEIRRTIDPSFRVNINLSPRDFYEQDCVATIGAVLADTGLPASALEIEITENITLNELAVATLLRINGMGVRIVVDDFGTGYSSLAYLKRLPVHAIKIDKSFINDVTRDPHDQGIVKAIATLGQTLGLRVIAEGIESEAQWEFVRSLHCSQAQGYFFHRALPAEKLRASLAAQELADATDARVVSLYRNT